MKLFTLLTPVVLAIVMTQASTSTIARMQTSPAPAGSLETLTYKTGWIPLGELTADSKKWATGSDPTVPYNTGTFEILGRKVDRRKPVLPKVGDRIRLTARVPVTILEYTTDGERHRLDPPMISRGLEPRDETGLRLEPGAVVEVRAVNITRASGQIKFAWARVSPPTK